MRKLVILFGIAACAWALPMTAQSDYDSPSNFTREESTYGANWFISGGLGLDLLHAEQDQRVSWYKRLGLGGSLTVGKWFKHNFGMSLQLNGGKLRGVNYVYPKAGYTKTWDRYVQASEFPHGRHWHSPIGGDIYVGAFGDDGNPNHGAMPGSLPGSFQYEGGYDQNRTWNSKYTILESKDGNGWMFRQDFNYFSLTVDVMTNLTNLMRGYDNDVNTFDFIPRFGLGVIKSMNNDVTTPGAWSVVATGGMKMIWNLNSKLGIFLEPELFAADRELDGYIGDVLVDMGSNLFLGLQYTFSRKYQKPYGYTQDEIDYLNERINAINERVGDTEDRLDGHDRDIDDLKNRLNNQRPQGTQDVVERKILPDFVRFKLDSYAITAQEEPKVARIADYIIEHPSSKFVLVGYADKKTGNPKYNYRLSEKRAKRVAGELVARGVPREQLVLQWKGDKEQPYEVNEWNRVVIVIER